MVSWLKKNAPGVSSSSLVAADQFNQLIDYITNVTLPTTEEPNINTPTRFKDNVLRVWQSTGVSFTYRFRASGLSASIDVILPPLTANDTFLFANHPATLLGKVIEVGTGNSVTNTGAALGGILKNNATKYVNFARGATDTVLTASATDLLYKKLTDVNIDAAAAIGWTKVSKTGSDINDLANVAISGPVLNESLIYDGTQWVNAVVTAGGGGGEANTGSNVGTAGVGVFKQKTGINLQFKKINSLAAGGITVTDDTGNDEIDLSIAAGSITNAMVSASAGIEYSKLDLTGEIQGTDFAAGSFPYASLNLTNSIVNADVNSSAAIAITKLALTGNITNTHINASAGIVKSKLANLAIANADVDAAAAIAWSKISKTGSSLSDLDNTDIAAPSAGQVLQYNGTDWVNATSGAGVGADSEYSFLLYKESGTYKSLNGLTQAIITNADFADLIEDTIDSISPQGTPTLIEIAAGDFDIAQTSLPITIDSTNAGNLTIKGQGQGVTNFIVDNAVTSDIFSILGAVSGSSLNLTANAVQGSSTITMSSGNGATLAANDYILLRSTKNFTTDADDVGKQGEICRVLSNAAGVITLLHPIHDTYNTADTANAIKLLMVKNVTIEGITIKPEAGYASTAAYIETAFCDNLNLFNLETRDNAADFGTCINLSSTINSRVENLTLVQSPSMTFDNQYGIQCVSACENVVFDKIIVRGRFRHAIMPANGSNSTNREGVCRNNTVSNCVAEIGDLPVYDTHIDGEGITFINCMAYGGKPTGTSSTGGFGIRSKNTKIIGCHIQNTIGYGISIFDVAHGCQVIGTTINKVKRSTLPDRGMGIRLDTDITDVEIRDCEIQNCGTDAIHLIGGNDRTKVIDCTLKNNAIETTGYGINSQHASNGSENCLIQGNTIGGNTAAIRQNGTIHINWVIQDNDCRGDTGLSIIRGTTNYTIGNTGLKGYDMVDVMHRGPTKLKFGGHALSTALGGLGVFNGYLTALGTGVHSIGLNDSEGIIGIFTTGTTINDIAGFRTTSSVTRRIREGVVYGRFSINNTATVRIFIGVVGSTSARTGADPLNALHGCAIVIGSGNFQVAHNDGTGATVFDNFDATQAIDTNTHDFKIIATSTGYIVDWDNGVTSRTITTDVPAASQGISYHAMIEATAGSAARALTLWENEGFF